MKIYKIIAPITLFAGTVRLTDAQVIGRAHKLAPVPGKKDCYTITGPNQFKAGEVIGYDGDMPKNMASLVEEVGARRRKTADEPQAVEQ